MAHKYLLQAFYNRINEKEYDLQIWQYNVRYRNRIAIQDMIAIAKKDRKNEELLAIENLLNKTVIGEVVKMLSVINLVSQYSWQ